MNKINKEEQKIKEIFTERLKEWEENNEELDQKTTNIISYFYTAGWFDSKLIENEQERKS